MTTHCAQPPLSPSEQASPNKFDEDEFDYPPIGDGDNELTFAGGGQIFHSQDPIDKVWENSSESDTGFIPKAQSTPKASPAPAGNKGNTRKRVRQLKLMRRKKIIKKKRLQRAKIPTVT